MANKKLFFLPFILLVLSLLLFSACSSLFFYPNKHQYALPSDFNVSYTNHTFYSHDSTKLHAWHIKSPIPSKGLLVLAHGNAENLSSHFRSWIWLVKKGYDLFIFDYRAYGKSFGKVDLKGSVEDVSAALDYVEKSFNKEYFLCGQSLGGTLSLAALAKRDTQKIQALILDSTFNSFSGIASEKMRGFFLTWPFSWIPYLTITSDFDASEHIKKIKIPVLFLHGSKDRTVPANHSWQLFDVANKPKEMWVVSGAFHTQAFFNRKLREDFLGFLAKVKAGTYYSTYHSKMKIYDENVLD